MKRHETRQPDMTYAFPLLIILGVVPLLTMMTTYSSGIGEYKWASGSSFYDFFLVFKSRFLMIMGGLLLLFFIGFLIYGYIGCLKEKSCRWVIVLSGLFLLCALLSAIGADEKSDAFFGGYEQMEGFFVVLTYIVSFAFCYIYVTDVSWIKVLLRTLLVSSLVISLLGALQTFGIDYLTSKSTLTFFTMFINNLPDSFKISASFGEGVSYATLFNPNYVGTYVALVLPVTVLIAIWDDKIVCKIMGGVSVVLQLIMLVGAQSMTGVIGVVGSGLIAFVFLFSDVKKNKKILGSVIGICALVVVGVCVWAPGIMSRFTDSAISDCNYRISSMESTQDSLTITLDTGDELLLSYSEGATIFDFTITDETGEELELITDADHDMVIDDEKYSDLVWKKTSTTFRVDEESTDVDVLRIVSDEDYYWDFARWEGSLYYINRVGKLDQISDVESYGFEGHYDLATNRGYIWSRTLPLLKQTLLLGVGQDNFTYAFPNDDYVGKVSCGFDGQIVTKPHNMYMQIWVQDGMIACLVLIVLYIVFAVRTFRRCFKKGRLSQMLKINIAIFSGVTGYMVAGLANDSTICVAPIFWILLGIGYAVNETN